MTPDSASSPSLASVSTPPTPSSQARQINEFAELPEPPLAQPTRPVSEDELQRRAQSDRASQAISEKMLQGWTLLAQECPNPNCHSVPLLKPPRARPAGAAAALSSTTSSESLPVSGRMRSSSKRSRFASKAEGAAGQSTQMLTDPRMLCVACGSRYLKETDVAAFEAYEAQEQQKRAKTAGPSSKKPAAEVNRVETSTSDKQPQRQIPAESAFDEPAPKRQHARQSAPRNSEAQASLQAMPPTSAAHSSSDLSQVSV